MLSIASGTGKKKPRKVERTSRRNYISRDKYFEVKDAGIELTRSNNLYEFSVKKSSVLLGEQFYARRQHIG